jgi:integrase
MAKSYLLTKSFANCAETHPTRTLEYHDTEVKGFGLSVTPAGHKAWFFRQNPYGYATIGSIKEIGVKAAREEAAKMKLQLRSGDNPFAARKRRRAEMLKAAIEQKPKLSDAWVRYREEVLSTKSKKHQENADRSMQRHFLSDFGNRAPDEVEPREFLAFREKHERERPTEMRQMKSYIIALYKWMAETATYMDLVRSIPHIGQIKAAKNVRTRKLTKKEDIQRLWAALDRVEPRAGALAVKFLLLSNRRSIEVRRMTVQQVDLDRAAWDIPAEENKSGRPIRQPLTPTMISIIREAQGNRQSGYVFSTTQGDRMIALGSKIVNAFVAEADIPHISLHDFRRTISTGMDEHLGIPHRVITLTAGHFNAGIEEHYRQSERRPYDEQMDAYLRWEKYACA